MAGTAVLAAAESTLGLPVDAPTLVRLHSRACIVCGARTGLVPAGHVYTQTADGGLLGWPVAACLTHQGE